MQMLLKIFLIILFSNSMLFGLDGLIYERAEIIQVQEEYKDKIASGFLLRNISDKNFQLEQGIRNEDTEFAKMIIYFSEYPSREVFSELEKKGVDYYPETWIPPFGNHPLGFLIAKVPTHRFLEILTLKEIKKVDSGEYSSSPQNNRAYKAINADDVWTSGYEGSGVKIAVLDSGLDSYHDGKDLPAIYEKKDYSDYPNLDDDVENHVTGHGTHVTDSALGRGHLSVDNTWNGGGAYKGIAPAADLCFLKIGNDSNGNASDDAMIAAMQAAINVYNADIITMSYGRWSTYHDGTGSLCQTADWCYEQGVPIFVSAGNDVDDDRHYSGTVEPFHYSDYIKIYNHSSYFIGFDLIWDDGMGQNVEMWIEFYDSGKDLLEKYEFSYTESPKGTENRDFATYNAQYPGTYYVRVANLSFTITQSFHLYDMYGNATFTDFPDSNYTVQSPSDADFAFSVGAWTTDRSWINFMGYPRDYDEETDNDICSFSSWGPRIDGLQKPNLTAPGAAIISLRDTDELSAYSTYSVDNNGDENPPRNYYVMKGTSMACPIVAGAAALYLEKNPTAIPQQVYDALQQNAFTDSYTGSVPNNIWGYGKLDIGAAMGDDPLPVILSSFTSVFNNGLPMIYWTTQSEENNAGWNIYRAETDILQDAFQLNPQLITGAGTIFEPTSYQFIDETELFENITYWYWLESLDFSGGTGIYGPISLSIPENEEDNPDNPNFEKFGLFQNYPNPFNSFTEISFNLKEEDLENAEISIYNLKGQRIKKYSMLNHQSSISWDGKDQNNNPVSSGIYFYRIETNSYQKTVKMLLME